MNNEIGRKITSLTLMTIMLAGGMTIAAPGMMPAAHAANANLFVSAENSQFDNYMSGPQVIEVVVIDSDINDTDEAKGEPDVTVNGKDLRMVQGVDGNWYGYFAEIGQAQAADDTTDINGSGLDFGSFCDSDTTVTDGSGTPVKFTDADAIAINESDGTGSEGTAALAACGPLAAGSGGASVNNVVRESKDIATGTNATGQIGIDTTYYPIIQLYLLSPGDNVVVQYNKGGGVQSTTLTFDTVDQYASVDLDRSVFPQSAEVHATITDLWLNIDPTDEDSWTFNTNAANTTAGAGVDSFYQVFDENGASGGQAQSTIGSHNTLMCEDNCVLKIDTNKQGAANPALTIQDNEDSILTHLNKNADVNNATAFGVKTETDVLGTGSVPVTITEQGPNSGVFGTYDEGDTSVLKITSNAARGTSATVDYNETPVTILVGFDFGTVDIKPGDDEWNSGEEIPVVIVDGDANKNSRSDEDLDLNNPAVTLIPSLVTGDPFTLGEGSKPTTAVYADVTAAPDGLLHIPHNSAVIGSATLSVDSFSQIGRMQATNTTHAIDANAIVIDFQTTLADLRDTVANTNSSAADRLHGFNFLNLDVRSFNSIGAYDVYLLNATDNIIGADGRINPTVGNLKIASGVSAQSGLISLTDKMNNRIHNASHPETNVVGALIFNTDASLLVSSTSDIDPIVIDFFSFGFKNDGEVASERIASQIVRIEAEESGDNTSTFEGTLEYIMINQLNILDVTTYEGLSTIADDPSFIVIEDLTDEDSPRVNYLDLGGDGVSTQIADQEEAPSHSGVVSFDSDSYKDADTVTITLEDLDLNVDSDLIDIYTVVQSDPDDLNEDVVGSKTVANGGTSIALSNGDQLGRLLDVTFDDIQWTEARDNDGTCNTGTGINKGLGDTGFTLIETDKESGKFVGSFQIPAAWCKTADGTAESVTGLDIEVNYVDFRDASGEIIEVNDSAGVRANTGSVSLDRTVYPVPFGVPSNFGGNTVTTPTSGTIERSLFPIHQTGIGGTGISGNTAGLDNGEFLDAGDLLIHVRINDPDFDISASGEDTIAANTTGTAGVGPVKISVIRGSETVTLGYAGGPTTLDGPIDVGDTNPVDARQFGPIDEIAPDAGIFEADITVRYTDGPASTTCPDTTVFESINGSAGTGELTRFDTASGTGNYCILQGDILQVEYTDPADASGSVNTVTDSATFDLRNGVLQADKSVYIIGSDMILTLIEPDLDLDNDQAETYDLDLIEWDSDAATISMGDADGEGAKFDPEPLDFRETGDSTGIFQIVIEIPEILDGDSLERGEEIVLEYTDWGPSGSDYVGDEDEDVNLTIFTSNFGATVELDQKVYSWTDKVYVTIVAPDHNFDGDLIDEIGNTEQDPLKISTRGFDLDQYKLVETGTDTGIFTGEVILTGFNHDADGDEEYDTNPRTTGNGPTDGFLQTDDDDGLTVSFEFSEDETVVGSSLIRWNIGELQWLEASYPAKGTGVVRVIDPDMNLDPEAVDNFDVDVWSDSDAGGIDLTVTETNEATGIYEGTVFFTTVDESSGHRLRVAEGDTVTAEYEDNTLPDPYTTADELDITATSLIGTSVPPLERAPAANLRTVDAFGNSLDTVSVDQQVQISADLANGQDREQTFAYLVQVQDANGVTVSLNWITGSLSEGQSFSPALSWTPTKAGTYSATVFVWESVDNPTALSPPVSTTVSVN